MVTMALSPAQKNQQLAEMVQAEEQFLATMNLINHANLPYSAKEDTGLAYIALYPLWAWNHRMIMNALESQNPRYQGMTKLITCGMTFFVRRGSLQDCPDGSQFRQDMYIDTKTDKAYIVQYSIVAELRMTVSIDFEIVYSGLLASEYELFELGQKLLLVKLGAITE